MNDLKLLESIRPEIAAMSPVERAAIRAELFGDSVTTEERRDSRLETVIDGELELSEIDRRPTPGRRSWLAAAAAAVAVVGVAGVWAAEQRRTEEPPPASASATLPPAAAPAAVPAPDDGRVTATYLPEGWHVVHASERPAAGSDEFIDRVYASNSLAPETGPALTVTSIAEHLGSPAIPEDSIKVVVQGVNGNSWTIGTNRHAVAFGPIDGFVYRVVGSNVSSEQVLAAAETVHPDADGYGAVIDTAALPDGVIERAAGFESEIWFISRAAGERPISTVYWSDGGEGSASIMSLEQDPATMALSRLAFDQITDTPVNGYHGYYAAYTRQATPYHAVVWTEDGRSYIVGSITLSLEQLHEIASTVRPASEEEWAAMVEKAPDTNGAAATTTVVEDLSEAADVLQPSDAYHTAVWTAREIVLGQCMARHGFDYRPRPIDSSVGNAGTQWDAWFELQKSQHPTFEQTMLGGPDEQAGGCQLEAFQAVHGPGEEAYSKLNGLYNQMLADLPRDADRSDANITEWVNQHRSELDAVHAELDGEQADAQLIIDAAG